MRGDLRWIPLLNDNDIDTVVMAFLLLDGDREMSEVRKKSTLSERVGPRDWLALTNDARGSGARVREMRLAPHPVMDNTSPIMMRGSDATLIVPVNK